MFWRFKRDFSKQKIKRGIKEKNYNEDDESFEVGLSDEKKSFIK